MYLNINIVPHSSLDLWLWDVLYFLRCEHNRHLEVVVLRQLTSWMLTAFVCDDWQVGDIVQSITVDEAVFKCTYTFVFVFPS